MGPPPPNYGVKGGPSKRSLGRPRGECNVKVRAPIWKHEKKVAKKVAKKSKGVTKRRVQPTLYSMKPKLPDAADLKARKKRKLLSALLDTAEDKASVEDWTLVIWHFSARDFGRKLVFEVTRADLGESFSVCDYAKQIQKVHACAANIALSLRHCRVGIEAGELKAIFMKPAFNFILSGCGLECFVSFANSSAKYLRLCATRQDHSVETRIRVEKVLVIFCGLWPNIMDIYKVCYPIQTALTPMSMLDDCGDEKMSIHKKKRMLVNFRQRVQPSALLLDPVRMTMSRITASGSHE